MIEEYKKKPLLTDVSLINSAVEACVSGNIERMKGILEQYQVNIDTLTGKMEQV